MRRFSFQIDLTQGKSSKKKSSQKPGSVPAAADGYEMSGDLQEQRQHLRAWPQFQRALMDLPEVVETLEEWESPNLGAEYVRVYEVTRHKVTEAEPGYKQDGNTEAHCFFSPDGTKHLVSRLSSRPHQRLNEIRLSPDGQLVRLHYECHEGPVQSLEDLFDRGLAGLEEDLDRYRQYPNYVLRIFLILTDGEFLKSTFRGVCYYDAESDSVVTEEAKEIR